MSPFASDGPHPVRLDYGECQREAAKHLAVADVMATNDADSPVDARNPHLPPVNHTSPSHDSILPWIGPIPPLPIAWPKSEGAALS